MKHFTLLLLLLSSVVFSCSKKEGEAPTPQPQTSLSLSYKPIVYGKKSFELLVTNDIGKTLLDTVAPNNTMLSLTVASDLQRFNITTIEYDSSVHRYDVNTYLDVLPKSWYLDTYMPLTSFPVLAVKNQGTITYKNIPFQASLNNPIMFASAGAQYSLDAGNKTLTVNYQDAYNNEAYLAFPNFDLYKLSPIKGNNDTVDFAYSDTLVRVNYSKPFQAVYSYATLAGYRSRGNSQSCMILQYNSFGTGYDVMFPPTGFEQFILSYFARDNHGSEYSYFGIADQVPRQLDFMDASYASAQASAQSTVNVQFLKDQPSFYTVEYGSAACYWVLTAPATRTYVPLPLSLANITSGKWMRGVDLGDIKPKSLKITKAENYDYPGALQKIMDTTDKTQVNLCRTYKMLL